ncbi:hypothetical protein HU200_012575 [Digitaria exilis]|uniref:Disease resistance protein At4g27190-like leucine-rich repeats domain-containing protein n=1 Tax=Digitaria exilis TaxID=1010633 RepID=A0A835FF93_9POAL|nr:hypothetical protein HU200_012575 [Digitaria exilis]
MLPTNVCTCRYNIDEAAERILDVLKEDTNVTRSISTRNNVIYFDGFDGLGASAVLQAITRRLTTVATDDQVIYIDCSKWESIRALQRAIAEQLALPAPTMEMFDRQDEEDDFDGVPRGSLSEIPRVVEAMWQQQKQKLNRRFLIIFRNGSSKEINLESMFGFPLSGYSRNKVLWTFQGRFKLMPRMKVVEAMKVDSAINKTDVFLSAAHDDRDPQELCSYLLHQEAAQVVVALEKNNISGHIIGASKVIECFLYKLKICCIGYHFNMLDMDYDLATHCSNYWVCDAIIQQGEGDAVDGEIEDGSWQTTADALQLAMPFDVDYHHQQPYLPPPSHIIMCGESRTTPPPYDMHLPIPVGVIPNADMFRYFDKNLRVLKLYRRTFNFSTPPFLYCHSLKFLWLEHCQDQEISSNTVDRAGKEDAIGRCFQNLWVLDVRYTSCDRILSAHMLDLMAQLRELNVMGAQDWDIGQLQGQLSNIRKLRVTKSAIKCTNGLQDKLFSGMNKMELIDFSGNRVLSGMASLSAVSNSTNNTLETIIIADGCAGLQNISFKGCTKLKSLVLGGLFDELCSIDISGTAVKTLDLSAMTAQKLSELFLLDCDKLCAILWPPEEKRKRYLDELRIDTTQLASTTWTGKEKANQGTRSGKSSLVRGVRAPSDCSWYISVKDTRLLRSVVLLREDFEIHDVHMEISSAKHPAVDVGGSKNHAGIIKGGYIAGSEQPSMQKQKTDVADVTIKDHLFQATELGDAQTITPTWPCPNAPYTYSSYCYMYIQDKVTANKLPTDHEEYTTGSAISIPDFFCDNAGILHVHDSLSITSIPGHAGWDLLLWCVVERCPMLEFIFTVPRLGSGQGVGSCDIFINLRTLWVSQLPKARLMWDTSKLSLGQISGRSFEFLEFLHLDFCPRLIHLFPFSTGFSMRMLHTIEIVWCGDLRTIFPLHSDTESYQEQEQQPRRATTTVEFQSLKRIHLHELPMLRSICGSGRMYAPNLKTIKIRGCWSLTRLPVVGSRDSRREKVECDCEKDWWDRLQWDGPQANHLPSLYKPIHPRYYKKTLLRGSVLL